MAVKLIFSLEKDANTEWINHRLAPGVILFLMYTIHFIYWGVVTLLPDRIAFKKTINLLEFEKLRRKIFLFGICCVFSMSYLQSGVFHAVWSWLTAIPLLALHIFCIEKFNKLLDYVWLGFYICIFIWFLGIIADYYSINNS